MDASSPKGSTVFINLKWPIEASDGNLYFDYFHLTLLSRVLIYLILFVARDLILQTPTLTPWSP